MKKAQPNLSDKTKSINILLLVLISAVIAFMTTTYFFKNNNQNIITNCNSICVDLMSDGMVPNSLSVKVGETVQFNSKDGKSHNIGLGEGQGVPADEHDNIEHNHEHLGSYESGDFKSDEAWRVTFKKVGTYKFHDHYNPKLNILVVVYDSKNDN